MEDLPPELKTRETQADGDDWEAALRDWADTRLRGGARGLLDEAVPHFERIMIQTALKHSHGHRQEAAKLLGWGRNTLTRKIKELRMDEELERAP